MYHTSKSALVLNFKGRALDDSSLTCERKSVLGINTISMAKINVEINQNHKFVSIGLSVKLKCGLLLSKPTKSVTGDVSIPQYICVKVGLPVKWEK